MKELFLLPPLLVDCALFVVFASGFLPGRTPILTSIARQARSHEIDAKTVAYSRKATAAWAAMSGLLGLFFATALVVPALRSVASVAAFFQFPAYLCLMVAEYRVRRRCLAHLQHMSFLEFLRFLRRVDYVSALRD